MVQSIKFLKNSPVKGKDGLGNKSNMKMSKCPKLVVMHNISIVK